MTLWVPFKVQRTSVAALLFSVAMHALVLVGLTQYNARPHPDLTLGQPRVLPPIEVVHLTEPMVALKTMVAKAVHEPAAFSAVDRTRLKAAVPPARLTKLPTPSHEIQSGTRPVEDSAYVDRTGDNPSDTPGTASKLIAGAVEQSRGDSHAAAASVMPLEVQPDQRPTQVARPDFAYNPQPDYPMLLREQGVGGVVWLRVWVDSDGRPVEIKLAKGSGYRLLDNAALSAVKLWRFIPAKNGEHRLASWVEFPIRFTLNG